MYNRSELISIQIQYNTNTLNSTKNGNLERYNKINI